MPGYRLGDVPRGTPEFLVGASKPPLTTMAARGVLEIGRVMKGNWAFFGLLGDHKARMADSWTRRVWLKSKLTPTMCLLHQKTAGPQVVATGAKVSVGALFSIVTPIDYS